MIIPLSRNYFDSRSECSRLFVRGDLLAALVKTSDPAPHDLEAVRGAAQ